MILTDLQRKHLSSYAEWRAIQLSMHRVFADLYFTNVEDVQFQSVIDALQSISQRRAAFFEKFLHHNQGGG